jgi:hypothetical protein
LEQHVSLAASSTIQSLRAASPPRERDRAPSGS